VQRFRNPQIMDRIIADGYPRVVKIFEDLGSAAEIEAALAEHDRRRAHPPAIRLSERDHERRD
jgi:hypothetical protein